MNKENMMKISRRKWTNCLTALIMTMLIFFINSCSDKPETNLQFVITFSKGLLKEPVTGRIYVLIFKDKDRNPRLMRGFGHQPVTNTEGEPFFAVDVQGMRFEDKIIIAENSIGYPQQSLKDVPDGDYYIQALLNVYTKFNRADGHVIWAPMDQWEGQHAGWSSGNLISRVKKVRLDSSRGYSIKLELDEIIPTVEDIPDTEWVKRVKIQSSSLSEFWGHPIYIGATVLLPKGYSEHPDKLYPTVYLQGHFSFVPPMGFSTEPIEENEETVRRRKERGIENGFEFYQSWIKEDFPRMFIVTFQHPTPYFDDSYAVNSANNGPYGDTLTKELIPFLEKKFRMIPESYSRILTGGSTGGYEALSLQIHYPRFFGGTWTFYPDPIDFSRLFLIDIYEDDNAFVSPEYALLKPERYAFRTPEGQPVQSVRQLSQLTMALGSRGRSCEYLEAWEAAFGPVGEDGYPKPLWDKKTGKIDNEVAKYWKENGYDLVHYLRRNWSEIGQDLIGKIHVFVGDMDNYYFNLPVYSLEAFLASVKAPSYKGEFQYGRPLKAHGWHPMTHADLIRSMAAHVATRKK